MPNMTFAVSDEMHAEMRAHRNIKWSEVVRSAIEKEILRQKMLAELDDLTKDSTLTIEDAVAIGKEINKKMAARLRKEFPDAYKEAGNEGRR